MNTPKTDSSSIQIEGELTSLDILLTFFERACIHGMKLDAVAEINIDEAVRAAKKCDQTRKEIFNKKMSPSSIYQKIEELPLLYGLPVSLKSGFLIKGLPANMGCLHFLDNIADFDGSFTRILKTVGAIPFIISSIPPSYLAIETFSKIYGRTKNPFNTLRTSGGSSGGEAVLLAIGCSPMGLGNDIGGSIRIPAAMTGVCGIKGTAERLGFEGVFLGSTNCELASQSSILPSIGPLATSVRDLALFYRSIISSSLSTISSYSPIIPLPFSEELYNTKKQLRIGYILEDDFFAVSPANKRAVLESVEILKNRGHELVEINFPNFAKVVKLFYKILNSAGGFRPICFHFDFEPLPEEYRKIAFGHSLPKFLIRFISTYFNFKGEKRLSLLVNTLGGITAFQYFKRQIRKKEELMSFLKIWEEGKLDLLLTVAGATPAFFHGSSELLFLQTCYTFYFNFMNFPSGVVPITIVKENEQYYEDQWNDAFTKECQKNLKESKGLPIGIQVVGKPFQEELVLNAMGQLEKEVKFLEKYSCKSQYPAS